MTSQIEKAAMWLSEQKEPPPQVIHQLSIA
jgi:hypothetical protein